MSDISPAPLNNQGQERFCRALVLGLLPEDVPEGMEQPRGSLRWAYATAYGQANLNAADVGAQRLLRLDHVRNRIRILRSEDEMRQAVLVRSWSTMLSRAQLVVDQAMEGKADATKLKAAMLVIERAEGPSRLRFVADLPPGAGAPGGGFGGRLEVWGMTPIEAAGESGPVPIPGAAHHENGAGAPVNGNGKRHVHVNGNGKGT